MNKMYSTSYSKNEYQISEWSNVPRLIDIIRKGSGGKEYKNFKFYTKSAEERKLWYDVYKDYLPARAKAQRKESVLFLCDSPRMTHLITNEIVEAEIQGYNVIIVLGEKDVGPDFFKITNTSTITTQLNSIIKSKSVRAVVTPCLNKVHNQTLPHLKTRRIGIQHGYGTWVEKNLLDPVTVHFNFGQISHREFNNAKSIMAGYSPTLLFDRFPYEKGDYILYLPQGTPVTNRKNMVEGLGLLNLVSDTGLKMIIKEHKLSDGEFQPVAGDNVKVLKYTGTNTAELMRKAALVITTWSGAGVESIFMNKPTVILDVNKDGGKFYKGSGLVIPMNYESLKSRVDALLNGKKLNLESFKNAINHAGGKKAAQIIIREVEKPSMPNISPNALDQTQIL